MGVLYCRYIFLEGLNKATNLPPPPIGQHSRSPSRFSSHRSEKYEPGMVFTPRYFRHAKRLFTVLPLQQQPRCSAQTFNSTHTARLSALCGPSASLGALYGTSFPPMLSASVQCRSRMNLRGIKHLKPLRPGKWLEFKPQRH